MRRAATQRDNGSSSSSRRYRYTKVLDNRKHPIRGLWRRNGKFFGRLTLEDDAGARSVKWVPLGKASTAAEAQDEFRQLLVERREGVVRHVGRCPRFADYAKDIYLKWLVTSGKKPDTVVTEKSHLNPWSESIGQLYLDKIQPRHVTAHIQKLKEKGKANRTCNLSLVVLRNVLKKAKEDGFIKVLPVDGIKWQRTEKKARRLITREEIALFCAASVATSKNGSQLSDYIRFLSLCGAREQEAIKLRWDDVDFDGRLLTVGADADTKNREARRVDLNPELEAHLRDMHGRRAPDSQWIFPSPQRGERDERAKTFRESLLLTRAAAGWVCQDCERLSFGVAALDACPQCRGNRMAKREPGLPEHFQRFGFHDCRHHFISYAVMSGIDFMTIARWVGHKDGGVLIGKVYGHLSNEHAQAQAARLNFGPVVVDTRIAPAAS
jgi:integrase